MDNKLTLKLNKDVIEKAKEYAKLHQRSLSRIIEAYLKSLVSNEESENKKGFHISPFVKSMSTGVHIPADLDYKSEYADHLRKK